MILGAHKDVSREFIHWLWLWTLAAIIVSLMQSVVGGQVVLAVGHPQQTQTAQSSDGIPPLPMPNVDDPDLFRYPLDPKGPDVSTATLAEVITANEARQFDQAIDLWNRIRIADQSVTWKRLGIGVAHLRLNQLDEALERLTRAADADRTNAVAEYFLGRVLQAKSRGTPLWYDMDEESPFRLLAYRYMSVEGKPVKRQSQGRMFLPHYRTLPLEKQAKQHFQRAIDLSTRCDLDRPIQVVQPAIQLVSTGSSDEIITIRDLLKSLGEEDYVAKARAELGLD